ncbi:MAG: hypothetical protein QW751_00405 [Candidatus Aenigmatarchaeota archaeon]
MSKLWVLIPIFLISGCVGHVLTPEQVIQQKDFLLGKSITVEGVATFGLERCTLLVCVPEHPCCNTCDANLILAGTEQNITISGEWKGRQVACKGNECGLTCWPLKEGRRYHVSGIWSSNLGQYTLELKSFSEV